MSALPKDALAPVALVLASPWPPWPTGGTATTKTRDNWRSEISPSITHVVESIDLKLPQTTLAHHEKRIRNAEVGVRFPLFRQTIDHALASPAYAGVVAFSSLNVDFVCRVPRKRKGHPRVAFRPADYFDFLRRITNVSAINVPIWATLKCNTTMKVTFIATSSTRDRFLQIWVS